MESSPSPIQIAIVGAGIGGLGLAIGLLTHAPHIAFTIYEAAAEFSAVGAGIAFAPNALLAMSMLSPAFRASYGVIATGNQDPAKQHVLFDMVLAEEGFGAARGYGPQSIAYDYFTKSSAHRWDLLQVMKALVPEGRVRFGKRAVRIWQEDQRVRILFADGQEIEADAAVGCDGGKGVSRQAVLGDKHPENVEAIYSGRYVYRAVVPMDKAREILGDYAGDGKMFMGPGTYFASYQMSKGTQLNMLAARQNDEPWTYDQWTQETTKEEMIKDFEGRVDSRLVNLVELAPPLKWSLHHHLHTPTYTSSQICLLGDSAHATTPHQGSGASLALEDAVTLSSLLALCKSAVSPSTALQLRSAFEIYDAVRRPRGQEIVRTSDEAGRMYCMHGDRTGEDFVAIAQSARHRFHWIWTFDLPAEVKRARVAFASCMKVFVLGEADAGDMWR